MMLCLYALLCCNLFCVLFLYLWVFAINVAWVASISLEEAEHVLEKIASDFQVEDFIIIVI